MCCRSPAERRLFERDGNRAEAHHARSQAAAAVWRVLHDQHDAIAGPDAGLRERGGGKRHALRELVIGQRFSSAQVSAARAPLALQRFSAEEQAPRRSIEAFLRKSRSSFHKLPAASARAV